MSEWIDVRERLPAHGVSVLCRWQENKSGVKCMTIGCRNKGLWFLQYKADGQSFPNFYWKVTHWMPLPESPIVNYKSSKMTE